MIAGVETCCYHFIASGDLCREEKRIKRKRRTQVKKK